MSYESKLNELLPGIYSSGELLSVLGSYEAISLAVEKGLINKLSHGIYGHAVHPAHEVFHLVAKFYPDAIIIGASALFLQGLSDYEPERLELAIGREDTPIRSTDYIEVKRIAESRLVGVEPKELGGVMLKIYSPERCLFDAAKGGPGTERFVKAINKYYAHGVDFDKIYDLSNKLPGGDIIRAALQAVKESKNIY